MLKFELEKLITSLSPSEKKQFSRLYNADKNVRDYVILFEVLCKAKQSDRESAEDIFKKKCPGKSFDNTSQYLFKVLINMLIQIRIEQDKWYNRQYTLMKARLCMERSLPNRSLKEIRKAKQQAQETEDHFIHYQASRMELTHLSDLSFQGLTEQELVDLQMKARNALLTIRKIHEHYSLYELLSYRILHSGTLLDNNRKKVDDLILSELSLTTRGSQSQFEPKKLHLLFQSFFFIHTGDFKSALKIFKELNEMIEANEVMWDFPPYDYLSALDGILESLRSIRYFQEMSYFIEKTRNLASNKYPEHFTGNVHQLVHLYTLSQLIGNTEYSKAASLAHTLNGYLLHGEAQFNQEKRLETLFYAALANFYLQQWKKALAYLETSITIGKSHMKLPVYRACRLLYILLHAELDNMEFLGYEIRAYKRNFNKVGEGFETEKYIFKTISQHPHRISPVKKKTIMKKWTLTLKKIEQDRNEQTLLKYYNFIDWIKLKLRP